MLRFCQRPLASRTAVTHVPGCLGCGPGRHSFHARAHTCAGICPSMLLCAAPLPELAWVRRRPSTFTLAPLPSFTHVLANPVVGRSLACSPCLLPSWHAPRVRQPRGFPGSSSLTRNLSQHRARSAPHTRNSRCLSARTSVPTFQASCVGGGGTGRVLVSQSSPLPHPNSSHSATTPLPAPALVL